MEKVLPEVDPDGKRRCALVSTWENVYNSVPDLNTLNYLEDHCDKVFRLDELSSSGSYLDIIYDEEGYKNHSAITTISE
jgi:hypothetical protein